MLRVECFGTTRPQDGVRPSDNQDAFFIGGLRPIYWMGLADGAGNANHASEKALRMLEERLGQVPLSRLLLEHTWHGWLKSIDYALYGGPESTIVGAAVAGDQVIGVSSGDSRAYHVAFDGVTRLLTGKTPRLGTGNLQPNFFRVTMRPRDVLVLASDGAYNPLGSQLDYVVRSLALKSFADLPESLIDVASRKGRMDDMTVVTMRLLTT